MLRQHGRFLTFGLTLTFLSSFGQTFFIALFNQSLRADFDLSHSAIGAYYSMATLASGLAIAWLGRAVDWVDLRVFTALTCVALAGAALGMAWVPSAVVLVGVFFLLRLTGQGLLSHAALTTMSRYFDETRGKAMALAGLGYPLGEAVLPIATVALIAAFGWREVWAGIGVLLLVVALPTTLLLLRGHGERHRRHLAKIGAHDGGGPSGRAERLRARRQWSVSEVVRDPRFYLMIPVVISPGFIVTGFFFHQGHLIETKDWSVEWFATTFAIFAVSQLLTGLIVGPLVDRFSGTRLLPLFALPMALGLGAIALTSAPGVAAVFMIGLGITAGFAPTVVGSMWAEVYGVMHLGAIRAMATSLMVFGTATSPILMGVLIDAGLAMETMAWASVAYVLVGSGAVFLTFFRRRTRYGGPAASPRY